MSVDFDPYIILGVTPETPVEEIKAAYRRAARRLHPDVNRALSWRIYKIEINYRNQQYRHSRPQDHQHRMGCYPSTAFLFLL